jgi:uncharacterized protein (TIGR02594 family)
MSMESAFRAAGQRLGMNERDQNAALQEFMRNGGQNLDPAVTAWCAAFVNASLAEAGLPGTNSLAARSFMDWGVPVDQPRPGDLAVFSRGDPNGWQGHVGFFAGYADDGRINVLGGNQGNAVSVAPYDASRLLGFRRAEGEPAPQLDRGMPQPQGMPEQQNALAPRMQFQNLDPAAFQARPQNALAAPEFRPRYLTRNA